MEHWEKCALWLFMLVLVLLFVKLDNSSIQTSFFAHVLIDLSSLIYVKQATWYVNVLVYYYFYFLFFVMYMCAYVCPT